jgi:hypothetical protein
MSPVKSHGCGVHLVAFQRCGLPLCGLPPGFHGRFTGVDLQIVEFRVVDEGESRVLDPAVLEIRIRGLKETRGNDLQDEDGK